MERQDKFTIMEGCEIPSHGLIYDVKFDPNIELRAMTTRDELKRKSNSKNSFKVLADIIDGCIIDKLPISVYDMAVGDYEYLLQRLRVVTYGSEYKMDLTCPHCGKATSTAANLDELMTKPFDEAEQAAFEEYRKFTLPDSGDEIEIKFQTPRLLDAVANKTKELQKRAKNSGMDFERLAFLETYVKTVNGEPLSPITGEDYLLKLSAKDSLYISESVVKLSDIIGVDNYVIVPCEECGEDFAATFWYGPEFFRPTLR